MKTSTLFNKTVITFASAAAFGLAAQAQSVDSLLNKLVEKGVLTGQEAKVLREEADKDFAKAHRAKTGTPEWI